MASASALSLMAGNSFLGCNSKSEQEQIIQTSKSSLPDNWLWIRPSLEKSDDDWKKEFERIKKAGIDFELTLPSPRFNRSMGPFAGLKYKTNGELVTGISREELADRYSPTDDDREYLKSIMQQVREPGKFAN